MTKEENKKRKGGLIVKIVKCCLAELDFIPVSVTELHCDDGQLTCTKFLLGGC